MKCGIGLRNREENKYFLRKDFIIILFSIAFTPTAAQTDCKLRKDQDSIKVFTCGTDTSRFKSIRAEFTLHASLQQLENFLLDFPNYVMWQYNTTESKSLRKISNSEFIYYARIEAPWPISDRDMVVRLRSVRTNKSLVVAANSEKNILSERRDFVRVRASYSKWVATETKKNFIEIKYEIQIDPGGNVPAWLINWVCAQAPYQSFKNLKEQIAKRK